MDKYEIQQNFLAQLAEELGVEVYRPDYHRKSGDKNTLLFYTKEAAAHNRLVDKLSRGYTGSEARDAKKYCGVTIPPEQVYQDSFWWFENSDVNGQLNLDFANFGRLDLRSDRWQDALRGAVKVALIKRKQAEYLAASGGVLYLSEGAEQYNDLNRELIAAMKLRDGEVYMGNVNYYGSQNRAVAAGASIYEEYTGKKIYNFACAFCVPTKDSKLQELVREWNITGNSFLVDRIMSRVEALGGINLIWG